MEAARARRLATGLAAADAQRLLDYAQDLEARARVADSDATPRTER